MGRLISVTAKSKNGQVFPRPKVVYLNEDRIRVSTAVVAGHTRRGTKIIEQNGNTFDTYVVFETAFQIEVQRNPSTTDLLTKQQVAAGLPGAGTTQGAGTLISKYFSEALTIGAAATEAFRLPPMVPGDVYVLVNNDVSGDQAKLFPAVGEFIEAQAVNTVYSLLTGKTIHLVCPTTAGKVIIADDFGR